MPSRWSRAWFAATAACAAAGVALSVVTAVRNAGGHFRVPTERAFNTFAFFTVDSNLLVLATCLLLVAVPDRTDPGSTGPERRSMPFAVLRLTSLVAITVTGVVYHVALASIFDLDGWDAFGNQLVHTVVPVLTVVGWLGFGPRGTGSARVARWSLCFPVLWLAFTLARGAAVHWYPYPFLDVDHLGYAKAVLNCCWVALLLFGLAAGAAAIDRLLTARRGTTSGGS